MSDPLTRSRAELEATARAGARSCYAGGNTMICRTLDRFFTFCPADDDSLMPHLATLGYWEPWVSLVVARTVKPGMRCVNVGANVGYYTFLMANLAGRSGKVWAFEPQPKLKSFLERSRRCNAATNTEIIPAAAGAAAGRATLYSHPSATCNSSLYPRVGLIPEGALPEAEVDVLALDDFGLGRVDVLLVDAEGSEPSVWEGARKTLAENPGARVLMEFAPVFYADPGAWLYRLAADGYTAWRVDYDGDIRAASNKQLLRSEFETLWITKT